ncbi:MAG: hypothetical protein ABIH66_02380, partial [bacterium]
MEAQLTQHVCMISMRTYSDNKNKPGVSGGVRRGRLKKYFRSDKMSLFYFHKPAGRSDFHVFRRPERRDGVKNALSCL